MLSILIWTLTSLKKIAILDYNCSIEADNHYLLESLAACNNKNSKLTMYFTINTTFANYLDMFPNLTVSMQFPLFKNRTTYKETLTINFNITGFDTTLLNAPTNLKDFINGYTKNKEIFQINDFSLEAN